MLDKTPCQTLIVCLLMAATCFHSPLHAGDCAEECDTELLYEILYLGESTCDQSCLQHVRAHGVNDELPLIIVGQNETDLVALTWRAESTPEDEADWCWKELIELIPSGTDWDSLRDATDINDAGWIVGYGRYDSGVEDRPFLLLPAAEACLGDTNDDGCVDFEDLLNVILDWGTDGISNNGDVNGSGVVDVVDLTAVILNWGPCPGETCSVDSLSEVIENAGLDWPDDWEGFIENIDDENYRCWFGHYLEGECCWSCPTCPPDCPGSDPFGGH